MFFSSLFVWTSYGMTIIARKLFLLKMQVDVHCEMRT
jgi:heme exporter protein D